jgi:membrane associated rhomboid family serine protease
MSCAGKCGHCQSGHKPQAGESKGSALVWRGAIIFLLPLVISIAGAALLRNNPHTQALGAVGGLIGGALLSMLICKTFTFGETE